MTFIYIIAPIGELLFGSFEILAAKYIGTLITRTETNYLNYIGEKNKI